MNYNQIMSMLNSILVDNGVNFGFIESEDEENIIKMKEYEININSLKFLNILTILEQKFEIVIEDADWNINRFNYVYDIFSYLVSKLEIYESNAESYIYIDDLLANSALKYKDNIALKYENVEVEYGSLNRSVSNFADYLMKHDNGERILIYMPNSIEFVIAFFSVIRADKIVILADTKYTKELEKIIKENNVRTIITEQENVMQIALYLSSEYDKKTLESCCLLSLEYQDKDAKQINIYEYMCGINLQGNKRLQVLVDDKKQKKINKFHYMKNQNDYAVIFYSSGSTGSPKGVINSHLTILKALKNYVSTMQLHSDDIFMAVTPFFHSYCLGSCFLCALKVGAKLVLQKQFLPRKILSIMTKENVTVFQGVPFMYQMINEHYNREIYSLKSIRLCVVAGAKISERVMRKFYELTGIVICQEYGSSETGTISVNLSNELELNIVSVGKPLNNVSVRIVDCVEGIGKIEVKSKGQAMGYLNSAPFVREWYRTGDLGYINENGYIHITGREKQIINLSGLKVNAREIEDILVSHDKVLNAKVYGETDELSGERIEAIVICNDKSVTESELLSFCKKQLASYKVPNRIFLEEESSNVSGLGKIRSKGTV